MKGMKTKGLEEVRALRRRNHRGTAMGRTDYADFVFIQTRLNEIEARIISMNELGSDDEGEF